MDENIDTASERGTSAVEYGLLVALVAAVVFTTVQSIGQLLLTGLTDFVDSF